MKNKKWAKILSALVATSLTMTTLMASINVSATPDTNVNLKDLTVEYVDSPEGIDVDAPRFGWKMDSNLVGAEQTAYQIVVKDADGNLAWDSGKVNSDNSIAVEYASKTPLAPETDYVVSVTSWDNYGNQATADTTFSTGVDGWDDAKWVSPGETDYAVAMMRSPKQTIQNKAVKNAKLYMTALGDYKAYINGQLVESEKGETAFDPGWVNYNNYIQYQTYDVTDYISGTDLVLSAELGRGWYKSRISANGYKGVAIGGEGDLDLAMIGKLVIEYEDGTEQTIATDDTWEYNKNGPIYNHDFYTNGSFDPNATTDPDNFVDGVKWGGEKYDASKEVPGWNLPSFDTTQSEDWNDVRIITYNGDIVSNNGAAVAYYNEENNQYPQTSSFTYKDSEINYSKEEGGTSEHVLGEVVRHNVDLMKEEVTIQPGERLIVNLGQNMAGVLETTMEAEPGTTVVFSHAEMLNDGNKNPTMPRGGSTGPDGTIYTASLRGEKTAVYKFGEEAEVTYRPDFTFFGFQYVQITATKPVTIKNVVGVPITSATKQTGNITTNNADLNQLFSNVLWSQRSNFLSIPTDCPQRNERCGWTGDVQLFAGTGTFNFDSVAFLQNYQAICDDQAASYNDLYTAVMPAQQGYGKNVSSGWSDVGIVLPWTLYQQTGDISIIEESFDQMDAYMDAIGPNGEGYNENWYGDWVSLQACSIQYLNLCYRAYDAQLMAKMAEALGYQEKVDKYNQIFDETKAFFFEKYVAENGDILSATADGKSEGDTYHTEYVDNSQTAISWALKLGFYKDEAHRQYIISKLLESIKNEDGSFRPGYAEDTLAVGFLGLNVILPSLSGNGQREYAYKLLQQNQFPSWLYSVEQGATSIWERWNSYSKENSFMEPGMNSFNHFSFGACLEWMYQEMAGISRDEANPGFKHIDLTPSIDTTGGINDVQASYDSYYGVIESGWTAENGKLTTYNTTVPANTTATLYLPVEASAVENFTNITGIEFTGMTIHNDMEVASFRVAAGSYNFAVNDGVLTVSLADGYVPAVETNKTILNDVIDYADAQMQDEAYQNVIPMVRETFEAALTNAKNVAADITADQDTVNNAWRTLLNEIHKLGFVQGDKASLGSLISAAGSIETNLDRYVEAGKQEFVDALKAARAVYEDDNAMQAEIDTVSSALLDAMMELRFKADKSVLEDVLAEASKLDTSTYTAESYSVLEAAVNNANAVLADENATQDDVDLAVNAVRTAIDGLVAVDGTPSETPTDNGNTVDGTQTGQESTTTKANAAKTGDFAPIAGIAALAVAGAALAITRRKK